MSEIISYTYKCDSCQYEAKTSDGMIRLALNTGVNIHFCKVCSARIILKAIETNAVIIRKFCPDCKGEGFLTKDKIVICETCTL